MPCLLFTNQTMDDCPVWWRNFAMSNSVDGWVSVDFALRRFNAMLADQEATLVWFRSNEDIRRFMDEYNKEPDEREWAKYLAS